MVIRLFWCGGYEKDGNFGDQLGPVLCEHLSGRRVEFAEVLQADLVTIGSILESWFCVGGSWENYRGAVWGSGRMFGEKPFSIPNAQVFALRGHMSRNRTGFESTAEPVLGDPGLLCHLLAPERPQKKYQLGIIPHISELDAPIVGDLAGISSEIQIIDMSRPVAEVIALVGSCRHVLSSALHGLILADALGIPNEWLRLDVVDERRKGIPASKYLDYYSVFGIKEKAPIRVSANDTLQSLLARFGPYARPGLEQIQQDLIRSFPYRR